MFSNTQNFLKDVDKLLNDTEEILKNIDELEIGYQIKLHTFKKSDWKQYFYVLSLDSHQNDQFLLNFRSSITFSGLALSKESPIKEIKFLGKNNSFLAKLGFSSPKLSERLNKIPGSFNSRWKCLVNFNHNVESLELRITLENGQEFTYGTIKLQQIQLSKLGLNNIESNNINGNILSKINSIQNSRQITINNLQQGRNYLFAIGNARSGTTALGKLLNYSPEICLGIERYGKEDNVSAMSFKKENFFDTNSKGYLVRPNFYEKIRDKFDTAKYVGDKRPRFIESWKNTFLNLPQAKIVYIFRHIYDVACSYNVRANNAAQGLDQQWQSNRDFSEAVKDWNEGIQEIQNLAQFYEVYFVKYESLFINKSEMIDLFKYLGVDTENQDIQIGIKKTYNIALSLQKKARILAEHEKAYIDANADFEAYHNLLTLYTKQFSSVDFSAEIDHNTVS